MAKNSPSETRTSKMAYCSKSVLPSSANWTKRFQSTYCPSIRGCAVTMPHIIQFDFSGKRCGLNWSAQHLREVYSQESGSPKFFADVDLDAARSCPVGIAGSRKGRFSSASIDAAGGWCFRSCLAARAVPITEVDFHIRGHREALVSGHLQPAIPGQRAPQRCGEPADLPAQFGDDRSRVF